MENHLSWSVKVLENVSKRVMKSHEIFMSILKGARGGALNGVPL